MDHRVSKDMISSGMTPSGEKTQADLGKTQYGSAPSPNRLMDAYHSMYQNQKEETLNEKMGDAADFASRNIAGARGAAKAPTPKPKSMIDKVRDRRGKIEDKEGITARREKVQNVMNKAREQGLTDGVDLVAAYQSIYADTFEEGKIPAGLQAFLDKKKGKKNDDDNGDDNGDEKKSKKKKGKGKGSKPDFLDLDKDGDKKEPMKKASKEMKEGAGLNEEPVTATLAAAGKIAAGAGKVFSAIKKSKIGQNLMKAKTTVDNVSNVANTVRGAGSSIKDNLSVKKPPTTATVSNKQTYMAASADLFDIVKGKLLDEGLSEEEIRDIMLELTPEEIIKELEESSMSDGSAGGAYQDLGPGGFRSKEQINRMHNDPKGTEKYGKKIMKRVGQAVRDTGTPTVRKVDESKK